MLQHLMITVWNHSTWELACNNSDCSAVGQLGLTKYHDSVPPQSEILSEQCLPIQPLADQLVTLICGPVCEAATPIEQLL